MLVVVITTNTIDLTPFGFTPTESSVYGTLLELGLSTGYATARAAGIARANTYAALEGLVRRGAAQRAAGRPARYRTTDPDVLLVQLAAEQGERLERLSRSLRDVRLPVDPVTRPLEGARAIANVVHQLVARAERRVEGVLAAELWRPTLPAWRRAGARATLDIRIAGEAGDTEGLARPATSSEHPTMLLVDDTHTLVATGSADRLTGLWSADPLIAQLTRMALGIQA